MKGDFIITGPDIAPMKFNSRREATKWCANHYPASSITDMAQIGRSGSWSRPRTAEMVYREQNRR